MSRLQWVLDRLGRRGPLPKSQGSVCLPGALTPDDEQYEDVRRRRGTREALAIGELRDRFPQASAPAHIAWRWAERKYDEHLQAAEAATGYDPDDEYRRL